MLSILHYPSLQLAYKTYEIVEMTEEYIPFYLAFREVGFLRELWERFRREAPPGMEVQVLFVDGAGVWHPKGSLPSPFTFARLSPSEAVYLGFCLWVVADV